GGSGTPNGKAKQRDSAPRTAYRRARATHHSSVITHYYRFQWKGFYPAIDEATKASWQYRSRLSHLTSEVPCHRCGGSRLKPDPAAVRFGGRTLVDVGRMPLDETLRFFDKLKLSAREKKVAGELLVEIRNRLRFLV